MSKRIPPFKEDFMPKKGKTSIVLHCEARCHKCRNNITKIVVSENEDSLSPYSDRYKFVDFLLKNGWEIHENHWICLDCAWKKKGKKWGKTPKIK